MKREEGIGADDPVSEVVVKPLRTRNVSEVTVPEDVINNTNSSNDESTNLNHMLRDDEDSEAQMLSNIEQRAITSGVGPNVSDGFQPAVQHEQPPLGRENLRKAFGLDDNDDSNDKPASAALKKKPSFAKMARKVYNVQRLARMAKEQADQTRNSSSVVSSTGSGSEDQSVNSATPLVRSQGHRRAATLLAQIDEVSNENNDAASIDDDFGLLLADPEYRAETMKEEESSEPPSDLNEPSILEEPTLRSSEELPLLSGQDEKGNGSFGAYAQDRKHRIRRLQRKKFLGRILQCLSPVNMLQWVLETILHSALLIAISFFVIAWFLYYHVGNPRLDFLPGRATLSWWLNFVGRHILLLELGRVIQFLLIDCIVLGTQFTVKLLGPLTTIFFIQSKGWPFVVFSAGILAMLLLHGEHEFQQHWVSCS